MSEATPVLLLVIVVPSLASIAAIGQMRSLEKRFPNWPSWIEVTFAGLSPTVVIMASLLVWHMIAIADHSRGPGEGFMSPLLFLLYGYPIIALNLLANFAAAGWVRNRQ